jgi:hypothetical protein
MSQNRFNLADSAKAVTLTYTDVKNQRGEKIRVAIVIDIEDGVEF